MKQLDYLLGKVVHYIKCDDFESALNYLDTRIKCNEKDVARCRPISESESDNVISKFNFNIGTALKHIFSFTRTIKKGNRPNKTELKVALKYINKEIDRLNIINTIINKSEDNNYEQN